MPGDGTASLDFGAAPGTREASVVVTGQTGLGAGSRIEVWLHPANTAAHDEDEYTMDELIVNWDTRVVGTGFTIRGVSNLLAGQPQEVGGRGRFVATPVLPLNGAYTVGWAWNG